MDDLLQDGKEGRCPLRHPPRARPSQIQQFADYCSTITGTPLDTYEALHRFSVERWRSFWSLFLDWSHLPHAGDASLVCAEDRIESAVFFPNLELNYAHILLSDRAGASTRPAILSRHADGRTVRLSRAELKERVASAAVALQKLGVDSTTRVAMMAFNDADAVVACLAVAALGGTVAMSAPEMGAEASIARFATFSPELLICHSQTPYSHSDRALQRRLRDILQSLPTVRCVVALGSCVPEEESANRSVHLLRDLIRVEHGRSCEWPQLPFNHPLFVLFSSGTTGKPKGIIHGAGGTVLEHLKEHRLHCDLHDGDRLFFHCSTAWMMWPWTLSALAAGVELVLYDGAVAEAETLWNIVAAERVSVFGTSPSYLQLSAQIAAATASRFDFSALRAVLSTGSTLYPAQQRWFSKHIKSLPIQSISGGTDIIGCFVMGHPELPVYAGEPQCKGLGLDVQALGGAGRGGTAVGELVCAKPFPSRPLGFLNDPGGRRFHEAYFSQHEGLWTHGDLIEFTTEGSAVMHGRSDGVMNIRGQRIGPADLYRVLQRFPEVDDAMAVEQRVDSEVGNARIVLLLVLRAGAVLNEPLKSRIRKAIAQQTSTIHVPAVIVRVSALPSTYTGKRSERSARDCINGLAVANAEALRNPECLAEIAQQMALESAAQRVDDAATRPLEGMISEAQLTELWQRALRIEPLGPDDDFFDCGGNSLMALQLLRELEAALGTSLPITLFYRAPTIRLMLAQLQARQYGDPNHLVLLKPNSTGSALFMVHGLDGNVMGLMKLARMIRHCGPVYGIKARGLDGVSSPMDSIGQMTKSYLEEIMLIQPDGPYLLCGFSFGGLVAYEMARQLRARGKQVDSLILLDTMIDQRHWPTIVWLKITLRVLGKHLRQLRPLSAAERWGYARAHLVGLWQRVRYFLGDDRVGSRWEVADELPAALRCVQQAASRAMRDYNPPRYDGELMLMRCAVTDPMLYDSVPLWARRVRHLTVCDVPGDHRSMAREPHVATLAQTISQALQPGSRALPRAEAAVHLTSRKPIPSSRP